MDTSVKCELNGNGRRDAVAAAAESVPSDASEAVRCIKRRRREPILPPPAAADGNGEAIDQTIVTSTIKRSSRFRGVSRHRWTGRFEAHLWDKGSWNATQRKKGKQVYLGAYDEEESAARAYDLAALKYWGPSTYTNFPVSDYEKEIEIMQTVTKEEYLASLRRKSSGFSRGISKYRGVARHHHNGRWEARIGRVFGNKYLYLGTYSTQEEAAHAYDIAAIEYRGINAVTNFDLSTYIRWLRPGANNNTVTNGETRTTQPTPNLPSITREAEALSRRNPFMAEGYIDSPCKQEFTSHQPSINGFCSKSSPTALSLLLRSSMFKKLVEKNSSTPDEENYGVERQQSGEHDYHGILYSGKVGAPYICSDQTLWNGVIGLPSMQ